MMSHAMMSHKMPFFLQVWDIRCAHSVRTIWGPYICGDALDMCVDNILTGSWVADNALQVRIYFLYLVYFRIGFL